jgi:predicted Fe-S protein YdhL (DUF1289 family)
MAKDDRKDLPIDNPCREICFLDEYGYCSGCHRTMEEVLRWPEMSAEERRKVMERIERRKAEAEKNV